MKADNLSYDLICKIDIVFIIEASIKCVIQKN